MFVFLFQSKKYDWNQIFATLPSQTSSKIHLSSQWLTIRNRIRMQRLECNLKFYTFFLLQNMTWCDVRPNIAQRIFNVKNWNAFRAPLHYNAPQIPSTHFFGLSFSFRVIYYLSAVYKYSLCESSALAGFEYWMLMTEWMNEHIRCNTKIKLFNCFTLNIFEFRWNIDEFIEHLQHLTPLFIKQNKIFY